MSGWTVPVCEKCWIDNNTIMDPGTGEMLIRFPGMYTGDPEIVTCNRCGSHTVVGIYERVDPAKQKYPTKENE